MALEVFIPKLTDNMEEGVITEWLVKQGDRVEKGQPLLLIETDKATMEIPSPVAGIVQEVRPGTEVGSALPVGTTLAYIISDGELAPQIPHPADGPSGEAAAIRVEGEKPRAAPSVRKLARDLGINLVHVSGTGPDGRITRQDLQKIRESGALQAAPSPTGWSTRPPLKMTPVAARMAASLGIDTTNILQQRHLEGKTLKSRITKDEIEQIFTSNAIQDAVPGENSVIETLEQPDQTYEWLELNRIQQLTGERMLESAQTIPQFCLSVDVDMTNTLELRKQFEEFAQSGEQESISITAVLVKAAAQALHLSPKINASFADKRIKVYKDVNIGVAVGTGSGLLVPVIHSADGKSLAQISKILQEFREKSKQVRFNPDELSGSTFTISNLGMYGVDRFQAIINPPESAILAAGQINRLPRELPGGGLEFRPILTLTLTLDHRVVEGMQGAVFLRKLKQYIEKPYLML